MSGCLKFSSSMTGSTNLGALKPQEDTLLLSARSLPSKRHTTSGSLSNARNRHRHLSRAMTLTPSVGQSMQLTPLWEHVVRTRRFPSEVDTQQTFLEISERLRDPEWEVRQHALRVLMDVLPTLNADVVDKAMQPVVPELINNLGHPAPAVRKGALDTLRVYLVYSHDKDNIVKNILHQGLNRPEPHDAFQTNVTTGIILSAPSLLFPSSCSPPPAEQLVKDTTIALASRLAQVPHQEAVLKSLMKIRDAVGAQPYDDYLASYDPKLRKNIDLLCKIYNVKPSRRARRSDESREVCKLERKDRSMDGTWESDSDTSGIVEEEEEPGNGSMPPARVVLETEIKFNEETAITMTILEEKESEDEQDAESGTDLRNDVEALEVKGRPGDRRRTPRRVHFGGEIVKLRTPDSDETESVELNRKTRIPLPVSPATKMPAERSRRRPSSQPCSPLLESRRPRRVSRSVSSSPKREVYTHNADLSPKKGILARTNSPIFIIKPVEQQSAGKKRRNAGSRNIEGKDAMDSKQRVEESSMNNVEDSLKSSRTDSRTVSVVEKPIRNNEYVEVLSSNALPGSRNSENVKNSSVNGKQPISKREGSSEGGTKRSDRKADSKNANVPSSRRNIEGSQSANATLSTRGEDKNSTKQTQRNTSASQSKNVFDVFPRQERNYILMELSSPERKTSAEKKVTLLEEEKTIEGEVSSFEGSQNNLSACNESTNDVGNENYIFGASIENKRTNKKEARVDSHAEELTNVIAETTDEKPEENPCVSPMGETASRIKAESPSVDAKKILETKCKHFFDNVTKNETMVNVENNVNRKSDIKTSKTGENERIPKNGRGKDRGEAIEENVSRSSRQSDNKLKEQNWEELGLVDQEVLEDLHNKDDWRARVRGFERVASALRTSSALIAIESRLGSLLHAVLGCERSCRVAAAGLAVAKVVVAGVNEDALKKRLPQLAWGLARQGGPSAAQLARITMLRLRPALLLEQLLQPQCLRARNAKTRENALQLLIFSLVTFPSTEFKIETVANRVASMVGDRRRRVRQAALDTLAVLAQIYESEEVLAAGRRAAEGRHDGEAMISAIRARLARKSLPLVSADGLVVYGLQISPTMQIATGPDVDWIVAGSGSVSPGTGRIRGQIIATTKSEKKKVTRNATTKNREGTWNEGPDLVALGVGLRSKVDKPVAWQIVPTKNQDDIHPEDGINARVDRGAATEIHNAKNSDLSVKSKDESRSSCESGVEFVNYRDTVKNTERRTVQGIVDGIPKRKEISNLKAESKIPILSSRDRTIGMIPSGTINDKSANADAINAISKRRTKDMTENNIGRLRSREEATGSYAVMYQRRKRLQQESASNVTSAVHDVSPSIDSQYSIHHPASSSKSSSNAAYASVAEGSNQSFSEITSQNYQNFIGGRRSSGGSNSKTRESGSNTTESVQRPLSIDVQRQAHSVYKLYSAVYRPHGRFVDESSFRALQTAPAPLSRVYCQDYDRHTAEDEDRILLNPLHSKMDGKRKDASAQNVSEVELCSSEAQTNGRSSLEKRKESPCRRRLRSLSPSQLYHRRHYVRPVSGDFHTMSMHDIDKAAVNEEEYNEKNKRHFLPDVSPYRAQVLDPRFDVDDHEQSLSKSTSSSSSDISRGNDQYKEQGVHTEGMYSNSNSRSSTPHAQDPNTAFDVITQQSNTRERDAVDSYIPLDGKELGLPLGSSSFSIDDDASKDWSSEDDIKLENRVDVLSKSSDRSEFLYGNGHLNNIDLDISERIEGERSIRRKSLVSVVSNERVLGTEIRHETIRSTEFYDILGSPLKDVGTLPNSDLLYSSRPTSRSSNHFEALRSSSRSNSRNSLHKLTLEQSNDLQTDSSEERVISSTLPDEKGSFQSLDTLAFRRGSNAAESPTIVIASRPHSTEAKDFMTNTIDVISNVASHKTGSIHETLQSTEESSVNDILEDVHSKDSASETNTEPGILKIEQAHPIEPPNLQRKMSKVPRSTGRLRATTKGNSGHSTEKSKPIVQQCFAQLENKDWEVTMKGLKTLSQIAKQNPEYLDVCTAGTIGRLLGRHIRNLRSQVARTACLAAGDIFSSRIRGIDQDIDDIAGPLLHRTADTNRFLRADSNAALDRMIEHLPPHRTIGVIVQRGANHQNAIVRAATARLLSEVLDRVGPEHAMILPRDVKDKLLNAGAKLLMDGNLDARNHAKKMFRRLTRCEGFRRALTDAVPETTLRHIDKTLKSL